MRRSIPIMLQQVDIVAEILSHLNRAEHITDWPSVARVNRTWRTAAKRVLDPALLHPWQAFYNEAAAQSHSLRPPLSVIISAARASVDRGWAMVDCATARSQVFHPLRFQVVATDHRRDYPDDEDEIRLGLLVEQIAISWTGIRALRHLLPRAQLNPFQFALFFEACARTGRYSEHVAALDYLAESLERQLRELADWAPPLKNPEKPRLDKVAATPAPETTAGAGMATFIMAAAFVYDSDADQSWISERFAEDIQAYEFDDDRYGGNTDTPLATYSTTCFALYRRHKGFAYAALERAGEITAMLPLVAAILVWPRRITEPDIAAAIRDLASDTNTSAATDVIVGAMQPRGVVQRQELSTNQDGGTYSEYNSDAVLPDEVALSAYGSTYALRGFCCEAPRFSRWLMQQSKGYRYRWSSDEAQQ